MGHSTVTVFVNGWCGGGCVVCVKARRAMEGLEGLATYEEIDTSDDAVMRAWGIDDGVYLDGKAFRPDAPPWTSDDLRAAILESSRRRNSGG